MGDLPSGSVTFLFTDVEGSTRLHQRLGADYAAVMTKLCTLQAAAIEAHAGRVLNTMGDGLYAVFGTADAAVAACAEAQGVVGRQQWPTGVEVRVRMGLHTGQATPDGSGGYSSLAVHQTARICAVAHGGQILASAATVDAATSTGGAGFHDLGGYRLRDFDEPVRLFQVSADGLADDFPAVRAVPQAAHNVPEIYTSFVGRERDLALLARSLQAHRMLTVLGPGGVGKTRLAFEAVRRVAAAYTGGAWVVLLASVPGPDEVIGVVAAALGAREAAGRDVREALVDRIGTERVLLVLDNCEHVADGVADVLAGLLGACPQLSVLATSREPLRIQGEHVMRLDPLDLPAATTDPAEAEGCDAVRLFAHRAEAADVRFTLDERTTAPVVDICRRLDGVPLAIELAAARVRHLPVGEIAAHLRDRLSLLSTTDRGVDARHQTLRAAIAWSVQQLSDEERLLYRRLSVFRSPFSLRAAERVCSDEALAEERVFDVVAGLVDKSLVALADVRDALRYRMLVTIGDAAREELVERGELELMQHRHAAYVVDTLAELSPVSVGSEPPGTYDLLRELESDAQAAFERLIADGDPEPVQIVATRMARLHFHRGTHAQGLEMVQRAGRLPGGSRDMRGWLLYRESLFRAVMGRPDLARDPILRSVEHAEGSTDPELPSCAWHVAGDVAFMLDDLAEARRCYETARGLSTDAELQALLAIRMAEIDAGRHPSRAVADAYRGAAEHFRSVGDHFNTARCLSGLGAALLRLRDPDAARVLATAVDAAYTASAEADAALAATLCAGSLAQQGELSAAAAVLGAVAAWEAVHGPAVDAMLVAHDDDVAEAVATARSAAVAVVAPSPAGGVRDAVRRAVARATNVTLDVPG